MRFFKRRAVRHRPAGTSGAPMTYMHDGKQYIAVAVSDLAHEGELVAFALP